MPFDRLNHVHSYLKENASILIERSLARQKGYTGWANRKRAERMRMAVAIASHTAWEWEQVKRLYGQRCCCCDKRKVLHKDHIEPVSQGGSDGVLNLQPLCQSCNSSKKTYTDDYRWDGGEWASVMVMGWIVGE